MAPKRVQRSPEERLARKWVCCVPQSLVGWPGISEVLCCLVRRRQLNNAAAGRQREKRKARDAELESIRGALIAAGHKQAQTDQALREAEAMATTALLQGSNLALSLQTAESRLKEALVYIQFLEHHISSSTLAPSPSPQASSHSTGGAFVPGAFGPFH